MGKELEEKLKEYDRQCKEEKNLTDEEICDLILRYIRKENSEYAILIDGVWGVGKTFFIKNMLKEKIQKEIKGIARYKGIIYMSLYGIKDLAQLEYKLIYSIIENNILNNKASKMIINGVKTYINSLSKRDSIIDTIKIFQDISKYIIIFDDLERCMIPITELLGYINELVEHKNAKTIIIANEEKMAEIGSSYENILYYEIKEKLIGEVIYYIPDLNKIIEYIYIKEKNEIVSKIIRRNKNRIIEVMKKLNYQNIRTLKICFNKFNRIVEELEKVKDIYEYCNEEIYNKMLDDILIYLLHVIIMYKENMKLYNWSNLLNSFGMISLSIKNLEIGILGFKFVDTLVQYSFIDLRDIKNALSMYSEKDQNKIYGEGSAFELIINFWQKNDSEVEEALEVMKQGMRENIYSIETYSRILCYLLEIIEAGYNEKVIRKIIDLMGYNIKNNKNNCTTLFLPCVIESNKEKAEYYDILKKWENEDREQVIRNRRTEVKEILKQKDWGTKFKEYCKYSKYEFRQNKSFFGSIYNKELMDKIQKSDLQNIIEFIKGINAVHDIRFMQKDRKEIKDYYKSDIIYILKIKKKIENIKEESTEKNKKYILNKILVILDKWIDKLK